MPPHRDGYGKMMKKWDVRVSREIADCINENPTYLFVYSIMLRVVIIRLSLEIIMMIPGKRSIHG